MSEESGFFRGAGGVIWEMGLPLREDMREQLTRGYLSRVNEDGSPYADPTDPAAEGLANAEVEKPPALNAPKSEWIGYAHRVHGVAIDDAEAMTKHDLIEKYSAT